MSMLQIPIQCKPVVLQRSPDRRSGGKKGAKFRTAKCQTSASLPALMIKKEEGPADFCPTVLGPVLAEWPPPTSVYLSCPCLLFLPFPFAIRECRIGPDARNTSRFTRIRRWCLGRSAATATIAVAVARNGSARRRRRSLLLLVVDDGFLGRELGVHLFCFRVFEVEPTFQQ